MTTAARVLAGLQRIPALRGWARRAAAFGFGVLAALAFAPLRWPLMLAIGLSGLALLLSGCAADKRPVRSAFLTGTLFGAGYFGTGMFWIANAFLVQADQFAWMIPVVLPLFFLGLGLFFGAAGAVHVAVSRRARLSGMARLLPLVAALAGTEWLRGHILSGLPWNLFAQAMAGSTLTLQPLAALGPYGYGVVVLLIAMVPAWVLLDPPRWRKPVALAAALGAAIVAHGLARLGTAPHEVRTDIHVVIVQPNVPQRDKLDAQKRVQALRRSVETTIRGASTLPDGSAVYAVWPENAYPFLARIPDLPTILEAEMPGKSWLVSGSIRSVDEGFTNGLLVFGPAGAGGGLAATYDKHRLVPFGETLPFYGVFKALGIESLSPVGDGGFIPGTGPALIDAGPAPFAPLICYEDVFPGTLYPRGQRPDWLVVVTNDAWFGDAAGPMQHLDIARMRAVESGLPLARSANTGISALIDAEGRVIDTLPLYEPGVITRQLPVARPPTLYERSRGLIFVGLLSFIASIVVRGALQGRIEAGNGP